MAFTNNRGRTQTSLAEINVTPLVDVMLVLLVIFMVTAPILQTGIQVNLPKTTTSKAENPKSTTVIVSIDKDGNVFISPEKNPLNVTTGEFSRQLKARLDKSQEKKVYVRGDGDTPYRVIAFVLAECKKLEAQVNLVTELDNKKS